MHKSSVPGGSDLEWSLRKCKHQLCTWVDACLPRGAQQVWHSAALQMQFFTWLPSWHRVGFETDGCDTAHFSQIVFWNYNSKGSLHLLLPQPWNQPVLVEGGAGAGHRKLSGTSRPSTRHLLLFKNLNSTWRPLMYYSVSQLIVIDTTGVQKPYWCQQHLQLNSQIH